MAIVVPEQNRESMRTKGNSEPRLSFSSISSLRAINEQQNRRVGRERNKLELRHACGKGFARRNHLLYGRLTFFGKDFSDCKTRDSNLSLCKVR
jgi:hypothetical protein